MIDKTSGNPPPIDIPITFVPIKTSNIWETIACSIIITISIIMLLITLGLFITGCTVLGIHYITILIKRVFKILSFFFICISDSRFV